ncbi:energy-coupling factor transporter transmembrane component T [Bacillaceae bacterium S4-13-58]
MDRGFRSLHPVILLLYYVIVISGLMLYQHPVFLLTASLMIIFINLLFDRGEQLKKWRWPIALMTVATLFFVPFFNRRGTIVAFYIGDYPVKLESVYLGIMTAFTLLCILMIFITFNQVVTPNKFVYLFHRVFPQWALLLLLSMRFVPLLQRRLLEMKDVQELKGLSVHEGTLRQRIKNGVLLLQALITWSMEESIQTADSMTARGYGRKKRTKYNSYLMKKRDWMSLLYLSVGGFAILLGWWLGDGVLSLTPIVEQPALIGREWFYLTVWVVLIGFPIWTEGKEIIKWKYFQQTT